jgi:hypothetical protein
MNTDVNKIIDYYNAGASFACLAKYFGRSMNSIYNIIRRHKSASRVPIKMGRKKRGHPTPKQLAFLEEVKKQGCVAWASKKFGFTRQRGHRIYRQWAGWEPPPCPYKPKDVILWDGKLYVVLESRPMTGTVWDVAKKKIIPEFLWYTEKTAPLIVDRCKSFDEHKIPLKYWPKSAPVKAQN